VSITKKAMRDVFIEQIYYKMFDNKSLFFLTADFGSPKLDVLRKDFNDRFINVGIAEQNLVNVATGLALEGFIVYAYAIAPFLVMRAYEQIRNNLSLLSHVHEINVNLIGVGAGLSYDVSGPTHHSLEDISIVRTLPNISLISPSDWVLAEKFADYSIENKKPKYIRFDGKPLPNIYSKTDDVTLDDGFFDFNRLYDTHCYRRSRKTEQSWDPYWCH
jgi:transketolase